MRVRFFADGQSGTATITAFSGGASGKLENLRVGSAGAERMLLTREPAGAGLLGRQQPGLGARRRRQRRRLPGRAGVVHDDDGAAQSVDGDHRLRRRRARHADHHARKPTVTANAAGKTATAQ